MATANHVLLQRITLSASASSVTFNSIPQTGYTDLKVVISATNTVGLSSTILKFNGSSSGYTYRALRGSGAAAASFTEATWGNGLYIQTGYNINGSSPNSNELYIPNYTGSSSKSVSIDSVQEANSTTAYSFIIGALWANSAAITSIELSCDTGAFAAGSSFSIYGIANAATTPVSAPKADGGDIIKTDGTYWYHTFLSSGSFKPQLNLTCDYLVVGGGGGGGRDSFSATRSAGGGGAGGYRTSIGGTPLTVNASTIYPITIGAGGAGAASRDGSNGGDSTFASITSAGGGYGTGFDGSAISANGGNGGSGGGAGWYSGYSGGAGNTPSTSPSQGNNGGSGDYGGGSQIGGGGGGASQAGDTANFGDGGNGTANSISGTSVTYAGGGGARGNGRYGAGGTGGGGAGTGVSGTANTGGGGGGNRGTGGTGGSGIVIIRYAV